MKTSINQDTRQDARKGKYNRYSQEALSVKDALTWFIITVIALCIAVRSQANSRFGCSSVVSAPVAFDITMTPLVQAAGILPFNVSAGTGNISSFTINTVPSQWQGTLSISMNSILLPVSEGMMITPDLAGSLIFTPDSFYSGNVVFTYSASDEEGLISNIANYTIPIIGKQQVILPISLLNFTGTEDNKKVQLYWQTENETSSSYFEVEKSADGIHFETVATETAQGNQKNHYHGTDDLFLYPFKTVYYRLKMVNINGSYKYSSLVLIQLGSKQSNTVKAWPMPFTSQLNIIYSSEKKDMVKITIRSINGSEVINISSNVTKGQNTIALYQAQSIPAGTYLLTISSSTNAETIKVIKQ